MDHDLHVQRITALRIRVAWVVTGHAILDGNAIAAVTMKLTAVTALATGCGDDIARLGHRGTIGNEIERIIVRGAAAPAHHDRDAMGEVALIGDRSTAHWLCDIGDVLAEYVCVRAIAVVGQGTIALAAGLID